MSIFTTFEDAPSEASIKADCSQPPVVAEAMVVIAPTTLEEHLEVQQVCTRH